MRPADLSSGKTRLRLWVLVLFIPVFFVDCRRIPDPNPSMITGLSGFLRMHVQTRDRRVGIPVMVCANANGRFRAEALDVAGNSIWILETDHRHGRLIDLTSRCAIRLPSINRSTNRTIGIGLDGISLFRILDVMSSRNMELTESMCRNPFATLSVEPDPESGMQAVVFFNENLDLKVRLTWMNLPELRIGGCQDRNEEERYKECGASEIWRLWEEWTK